MGVLPTPPFWFAIVMIRQRGGRGQASRSASPRTPTATWAARPIGVSASLRGISGMTTGGAGASGRPPSTAPSTVTIPDLSPFTSTPLDP